MNPNAIYSKSGKGVQEASGKTSLLSRPDRAVLSAIDGRATLADVAQKVGKTFDPAFEKLIETLDKSGFIRAVSAGTASAKPPAGAKSAAKPTAPMDAASDLDFTAALSVPKGKAAVPPPQAPPKAAPPPPKQTVTIPPPPPPPTAAEKAKAEQVAKEQQDAFTKAREEAERKATAERERLKAEAEAKVRAEQETKLRAEAESKAKADAEKKLAAEAEAKVKAAQAAAAKVAAEAKAKAEAEAKKAREEAERVRKEAEEKLRREQEEMKRKLEEERKAREEAERKAKEEARRLEEERRKLEEERRRIEEERKREEAERAARRKAEEEEEKRLRAERERAEREARRKAEAEEQAAAAAAAAAETAKAKETQAPKAPGSFSDSLLADLESFTNPEEAEAKAKAEADAKAKAEAERRAREEAERRAKEDAERSEREEREEAKRREKEEAAARKRAEERELREREEREKERLAEEEEKRKKEAEEREKKAKQEERLVSKATQGARPAGEAPFSEEEALRKRRERQLGPSKSAAVRERISRGGWGKPIAITLFLLLIVGLGVAHIMPLPVDDYRSAAEEALGRPVKIGAARLSLLAGMPELKFSDVVVGETRIAEVRAFPELDALTGPHKRFSRIEIAGAKVDQDLLGQALFAKVKGDNFGVARVTAKNVEFIGPLVLPKGLELDAQYDADGMVRAATIRGPEALVAKLARKDNAVEVEMSSASFSLPFAPEITLSKFGLKGNATPRGLAVSEWDGQFLNGTLSGTANVRWGDTWLVDGVLTARNITAAVFAPALLSDGRGEGSGKFTMRGDPGKLATTARLDGSFTITRGVLGTIDLSRAIQTGGKQATGRTQFNEMNGHAVYDRGAVALRNVTISAGQLNAGASADIAQSGALSGRIVADVKVSSQTLRATLNLGGTVKEPQVRN